MQLGAARVARKTGAAHIAACRGGQAIESRGKIIAEIRRLSFELGRAPGSYVFETETGIRVHEWRGVYWPRWSEALRDAGLEPNKRLEKSDPDVMLEQLAIATRRLGHFPTVAELDLYRRTFPVAGDTTLRGYFTNWAGLAACLKLWTAARPDYADVAARLARAAGRPQGVETAPAAAAEGGEGAVRLFRFGYRHCLVREGGPPGWTRRRASALPSGAILEHAIQTDDPAGVDRYWRGRFAHRRLTTDWFVLRDEDVAAFRRWVQI